jgi:hypothetical protein
VAAALRGVTSNERSFALNAVKDLFVVPSRSVDPSPAVAPSEEQRDGRAHRCARPSAFVFSIVA